MAVINDELNFDEITMRRKSLFATGKIKLVGNRMMSDGTGFETHAAEYNELAERHARMARQRKRRKVCRDPRCPACGALLAA